MFFFLNILHVMEGLLSSGRPVSGPFSEKVVIFLSRHRQTISKGSEKKKKNLPPKKKNFFFWRLDIFVPFLRFCRSFDGIPLQFSLLFSSREPSILFPHHTLCLFVFTTSSPLPSALLPKARALFGNQPALEISNYTRYVRGRNNPKNGGSKDFFSEC